MRRSRKRADRLLLALWLFDVGAFAVIIGLAVAGV